VEMDFRASVRCSRGAWMVVEAAAVSAGSTWTDRRGAAISTGAARFSVAGGHFKLHGRGCQEG
jgi:hypothetical protein